LARARKRGPQQTKGISVDENQAVVRHDIEESMTKKIVFTIEGGLSWTRYPCHVCGGHTEKHGFAAQAEVSREKARHG